MKLIKGLRKPLVLFAKTHLKGRTLVGAQRLVAKGRVVLLGLSGPEKAELEFGLFSGGQNVFLRCGGKAMSAYKPKPYTPMEEDQRVRASVRKSEDFLLAWQDRHRATKDTKAPSGASANGKTTLEKDLKKKKQGLEKMQAKLLTGTEGAWERAGQWLKENPQMTEVPEPLKDYVDVQKSYAWNLDTCFAQVKKIQKKKAGTLERIEILKKEILSLEAGHPIEKAKPSSLLQEASAKGRTQILKNDWRLFVGKSAKDNLSILRRAKPWYLWLHIRDFPGAYGIIERPRKAGDPSPEVLQEAAIAVAKRSVRGQTSGTYEVIFAECRYVRPIPKAKTGQVTYSHEKVVSVRL